MLKSQSKIKNEDGSTLVETLVAMAILISVLLPTSLFLGYIAANPLNEGKIIALGLAQTEMEKILDSEEYTDQKKIAEDKWIVKSTVSKEENLVQLEVAVYRKNRSEKPIIILNTERLLYENETSE